MHAKRAHADSLVPERGAHHLLTAKGTQPSLHTQLKPYSGGTSLLRMPAPTTLTAGPPRHRRRGEHSC